MRCISALMRLSLGKLDEHLDKLLKSKDRKKWLLGFKGSLAVLDKLDKLNKK
jgi:hypothetical protein